MSPSERTLLKYVARNRRTIEAGALIGRSTLDLASVAQHVISIDRHTGYGPDTLQPYMRNIDSVRSRVTPLIGDVREYLPGIEAETCLIDLLGTYEITKYCLDHLHPSLKFAAIHDTHRPFCSGVDAAIQASLDTWEPIMQADTLTILARRRRC